MEHEKIVNKANQLLEQYKADPASIDPTLVQLLNLQAAGRYGAQVEEFTRLANGLSQEVGQLRRIAERMAGDEPEARAAQQPTTAQSRRVEAIRARGRRNGATLRGRGR